MRRTVALLVAAACAALPAAPAAARTVAGGPPADEVQPGWFAHRPITIYVQLPPGGPGGPPPAPDPALPDAEIFLIAPIDPEHPQDPGVVIPSPPAPAPIVVPVHDTVVTRPRAYAHRANCFGIQVVPGPRAPAGSVLTRPDPNGGATLAYAVRLGGHPLPLNAAAAIRLAAALGLVALDRSWPGYGGTCWTGRPGR